jgi:hypothetical protein
MASKFVKVVLSGGGAMNSSVVTLALLKSRGYHRRFEQFINKYYFTGSA